MNLKWWMVLMATGRRDSQEQGTAESKRNALYALAGKGDRETRLNVTVENIGELAVVECEGSIVRSQAASKLREAVTS
jgi:hypothetical protein